MLNRYRGIVLMAAIAGAVFVVDQLTKAWISSNMALRETRPIIEGFVRLRYTGNTGAAFGMFQGWTSLLSIAAITIIAVIVLSASRIGNGASSSVGLGGVGGNLTMMLSLGLVLGGAFGNLVDRLRLGFVRDFVEVYGPHIEWNNRVYTWPVFNAADSAISVGVVIIIAALIFGKQHSPSGSGSGENAPSSAPHFTKTESVPRLGSLDRTGTDD